jgi:hypothetical protein
MTTSSFLLFNEMQWVPTMMTSIARCINLLVTLVASFFLLAKSFRQVYHHDGRCTTASGILRIPLRCRTSSETSQPVNQSNGTLPEVSSFSLQSYSSHDNLARTKPTSRNSPKEELDSEKPLPMRKRFNDDDSVEDRSLIDLGLPLGKDAYIDIDGIPTCRIINGLWQVCGELVTSNRRTWA